MLNIAIDGPSGAGKSTIAKGLAEELNILYLDTGAMYRAIGVYLLRHGIDPTDETAVTAALPSIHVDVQYRDGTQILLLNGEDVTDKIRENPVSKAASDASAHPKVREELVRIQQDIASHADCVLDGRDIGTVVLPYSKNKFYITALPEVRAKRRFLELQSKGQEIPFEKVLSDLNARDYNDSHRAASPLRRAKDATLLDTSEMTIREVLDAILQKLRYD